MAKIVLDPVGSGYNLTKINENFQAIEDELNDKVLYRDNPEGEPNTWETTQDANSQRLINLVDATTNQEPVTLSQYNAGIAAIVANGIDPDGDYTLTGDWTFTGTSQIIYESASPMLFQLPANEIFFTLDQTSDDIQFNFRGTTGQQLAIEATVGGIEESIFGYDFDEGTWYVDTEIGVTSGGGYSGQASDQVYERMLQYDTSGNVTVLTNGRLNGDVDIRTNGTGSVLVNGSPIGGGGGSTALTYQDYLTGEDSGATARNLIGVDLIPEGVPPTDAVLINYDDVGSGTGLELGLYNGQNELALGGWNSVVNIGSDALTTIVESVSTSGLIVKSGSILTDRPTITLTGTNADPELTGTQLGFIQSNAGELIVSNAVTNADLDLRTTGTGQVLINGSPAGYNLLDVASLSGSDATFGTSNEYIYYNGTGGDTVTVDNNLPIGGCVILSNTGTGTLTISAGADTLNWFTGAGVTTGNRTLAIGGMVTIVRRDASNIDISGGGLS